MIVVPLLIMPLLTIGMGVLSIALVGVAMREVPQVMILGGKDSPGVMAELHKMKDLQIVPTKADYAEEISNKKIRAAVEIPDDFETKLAAGESSTVKIYMYEGENKSGFGATARSANICKRAISLKIWLIHLTFWRQMSLRPKKWEAQSLAASFLTS
jgi:sodium transport system permease protein